MNFDDMKVFFDENKIKFGDKVVKLTPRAMEIFYVVYEQNGRIISKDSLIRKVWGATDTPLCINNSLSVQINSINCHLRPFGYFVVTIRGRGFALRDISEKVPSVPKTKFKMGDEELTIREWAKKYALSIGIVQRRIGRGWPIDKSVTTPPIKKREKRAMG